MNLASVKLPAPLGNSPYPLQVPVTKTYPFLNQNEAPCTSPAVIVLQRYATRVASESGVKPYTVGHVLDITHPAWLSSRR